MVQQMLQIQQQLIKYYNEEEVYKMAEEVLGLHLFGMEQDNEEIPESSSIKNIQLENNESTMIVNVFMPSIRERINNKVIKKTLTIPSWLNTEEEHKGVNFSQLLQKALKEYLKIEA